MDIEIWRVLGWADINPGLMGHMFRSRSPQLEADYPFQVSCPWANVCNSAAAEQKALSCIIRVEFLILVLASQSNSGLVDCC